MSDKHRTRLYSALERFETAFNFMPFFDGQGEEEMLKETFINKLNSMLQSTTMTPRSILVITSLTVEISNT